MAPAIPMGEILLEEFLELLDHGQVEAARHLGISLYGLNEIVLRKRGLTRGTHPRASRARELLDGKSDSRPLSGNCNHRNRSGSDLKIGIAPGAIQRTARASQRS